MKRKYELTVICKEADEDRKAGVEFLEGVLSKFGAGIISRNEIGLRKLAYEIQKSQRGFYQFYLIEADSDSVSGMMRELNMSHTLLRWLFVEKDELTAGQIAKRQERERKMKDFLAKKARNSAPVSAPVPDKDSEMERQDALESVPVAQDAENE